MPSIKECVSLHIGQAGCQVGARSWELFTQEHGIHPDGTRGGFDDRSDYDPDDDAYNSFFHATGTGQYVPRCVMVDTEPTVINDIKVSSMRNLFHPDSLIHFKRDCKSNYFEGLQMARDFKIADIVMDRMRSAIELCDNPQGFFVFHAFGGGTGAGVGVELLKGMREEFGKKKAIFQPVIFPSKTYSSSIVEPYNCLLATSNSKEYVDMSILMDNEAVYRMCNNNLQLKTPHFNHVNCLIAQCISGLTGPLRYETVLNSTLTEIQNNLVPKPEFMYPILSIAPVRHEARKGHEQFRTADIIGELFDGKNFLCDVTALNSNRYLAAVVMMRGHREDDQDDHKGSTSGAAFATMSPADQKFKPINVNSVTSAINSLRQLGKTGNAKRVINFVPWMSGSGVKVGIVKSSPVVTEKFCMATPKRQGLLLGNTTAVRQLFSRQYIRFLKLWFKRAYQWQMEGAGGTIEDIEEAKETVRTIMDSYEAELGQSASQESQSTQPLFLTSRPLQ